MIVFIKPITMAYSTLGKGKKLGHLNISMQDIPNILIFKLF